MSWGEKCKLKHRLNRNIYFFYFVLKSHFGLNSIYFETIEKQYKYYTNLSCQSFGLGCEDASPRKDEHERNPQEGIRPF